MRAVVHHAKFLLDHGRDALAGPHVAHKPIGLGSVGQQGRQLGRCSADRRGAELGGMRWTKAGAPPSRARLSH